MPEIESQVKGDIWDMLKKKKKKKGESIIIYFLPIILFILINPRLLRRKLQQTF